MRRTPKEQLVHFLSDMYSVEQQALRSLSPPPKSRAIPDWRTIFACTTLKPSGKPNSCASVWKLTAGRRPRSRTPS